MDLTTVKKNLCEYYQTRRKKTKNLCTPLEVEDYVIQSIDEVSPPKWHLAHTTWFFETFVLSKKVGYQVFNPLFHHLFNSYYQAIGNPYPRGRRGLLSRPTVKTILDYRDYVDEHLLEYVDQCSAQKLKQIELLIIFGLNHEEQHQELLLMDIKHNFFLDASYPIYCSLVEKKVESPQQLEFVYVNGGVIQIGYQGKEFCFDNELPRYELILKPYLFANRLVTNGEYEEFINAGGYETPDWWLADGWECILKNNWRAPLYWQRCFDKWHIFTLNGLRELDPHEPVSHVSYYEADAYARWRGMRLCTEAEWEHYISTQDTAKADGNFLESNMFHPQRASAKSKKNSQQLWGDVWEWTSSPYAPYPGYKTLSGVLGEYNGKFMSSQFVLRGGCCVTPQSHVRASYRNFFQPDKRWQFSGIRLANDVDV